ncbi:MAG: thiol peroxidase [Candidatus Omnitrophota bacterium]
MGGRSIITVKGKPLNLAGEKKEIGQNAPDVVLLDPDLNEVRLSKYFDKIKLIASVPSLDTPICDLEIKRFNDEAVKLSKEIVIIFISMDLPFAQKRFRQSYGIKKVHILSDHKNADFGEKYGVLIEEMRLLARAVFVVDKKDKIKYAEYVDELTNHPNYDKALAVLGSLVE